jgi:hypothetical protein
LGNRRDKSPDVLPTKAEVEGRRVMAEQIRVVSDGEEVVITAEGAVGRCEVRLKLDEAERFQDILDRAVLRADEAREAREAEEALKIERVDEEDGA